jgi:beta-lactamase superfamily II metal-dependent hydrolase
LFFYQKQTNLNWFSKLHLLDYVMNYRNKTEFRVLKAFHGDCILIKTFTSNFDEFVILIDGGTASTFNYFLKKELEDINIIDLVVLTHIDSDHIGGLLKLLGNSIMNSISIKEFWINHPELIDFDEKTLISVSHGNKLKELISKKLPNSSICQINTSLNTISRSGIKFEILSPSKEIVNLLYKEWKSLEKEAETQSNSVNISKNKNNYSTSLKELSSAKFKPSKKVNKDIFNASSIAFNLRCPDVSILLLADSRAEIVIESLNKLGYNTSKKITADYVKVSHHGSSNNTSKELLNLIESKKFLISTNGGSSNHKHPSREVISKLLYNDGIMNKGINIFFNYSISDLKAKIGIFLSDEELNNQNWFIRNQNVFLVEDNE